MTAYLLDWIGLLARWFHLVAGVSWIGTSLYFVWLDDHLRAPQRDVDTRRGVAGELWSVHGGGFYHNQKYLLGPAGEPLTADLHWFKWEAYATWLSGVAMLALVYWAGASTLLIDPSVAVLSVPAAVALSAASLVAGWFVYDALCRLFGERPLVLGGALYAAFVLAAWALFHVFAGRAAYLHAGAIAGTIMAANVFFVIIPGQRRVVEAIRAGRAPDPALGARGKTRSVHNTYLTLPVLFTMISAHYPMTYGSAYGWLILALLGLAGVLVRRFFILSHRGRIVLLLPAAAAVSIAAAAALALPRPQPVAAVSFAVAGPIIAQRCAVCHAAHPLRRGYAAPPAGVMLDTPEHIAANAARIDAQAVRSRAMPLGNVTGMTPAERDQVGAWIAGGAQIP